MSVRSTSLRLLFFLVISIFSHPKGDILRNLTLLNPNGVILFDENTLNHYVFNQPRPYDVVIFVTEKKECKLSKVLRREFEIVSESYKEFDAYKPDLINRKRAVFFGLFFIDENRNDLKRRLNFSPNITIIYTIPHHIKYDPDGNNIDYQKDYNIDYKEGTENWMPLLEFVNLLSKSRHELKKSPLLSLIYFLLFIGFMVAALSLFLKYKNFFVNPLTWYVISLILFIVSISGTVWNILNGAHLVKFDHDWSILEYVHKNQRRQYTGEGIFMGFLFVIIGIILTSLRFLNLIERTFRRFIVAIILFLLIILSDFLVVYIYRLKAPWYGPSFNPPNQYIKGPLIRDQGNAF